MQACRRLGPSTDCAQLRNALKVDSGKGIYTPSYARI
jgi:hypothetical protein